MIDLNKIRSIKTLEGVKQDLTDFIAVDRKIMLAVYDEEYNWGEEDYDADLEQVKELLEQTERRIHSLGSFIRKQKVKGKCDTRQSDETESPSVSQPA